MYKTKNENLQIKNRDWSTETKKKEETLRELDYSGMSFYNNLCDNGQVGEDAPLIEDTNDMGRTS